MRRDKQCWKSKAKKNVLQGGRGKGGVGQIGEDAAAVQGAQQGAVQGAV